MFVPRFQTWVRTILSREISFDSRVSGLRWKSRARDRNCNLV